MNEQRVTSVDDTSWAPATGGFLADDAPFGSVLGDPLTGSPIFDVSVLDATPGTQPEDDVLYQERAGLSAEERAQVARADRLKAGAARRDAAHRQARGPARRLQPPQQAPVTGAPQYGYVPTAPPSAQQPVRPVPGQPAPGQYGRPVPQPAVPRRPSRDLVQAAGRPAAVLQALPQQARPQAGQQRKRGSGAVSWVWVVFIGLMMLRACAD
ncbi:MULTISPECIES: hypothetical protein [unclassified Actinomyces]|uniref:hypothetical protein n=1 Tax=unclassified Actinomyces TaxID=2609248 RepID=UPI0020179AA1|nr:MULTISPECIES: hypothetical protein [unclassified Actinomyces]MCL3777303.1 hypothetical protein [Actinomyces sp. AC-20-1]MCL3789564.1 hypothetical protein [Actinomyces sp. 187325]MCL3791849.1 hypothetical protein [Actinomyces sp. 186855]MCL3793665.1 hypothetical protein [Actinomyces sp. 217892]